MSTFAKKQRIAQERKENTDKVISLCESNNLNIRFVTEYQIRIDHIVDVYPTNKKYCYLKDQLWGNYNREIEIKEMIDKHNAKYDLSKRDEIINRINNKK